MIETRPEVFLIAKPVVDLTDMIRYLRRVGGEEWYNRVVAPLGVAGATSLVEFCGRLCYKSWKPGLNKNVTKIREDSAEYLLNILTVGHGSVIEHAHFTFVLHDVSRVLTAELNRHRHPNISEQSLRYVRLDELRFRVPTLLPQEVQDAGREIIKEVERFQAWAAEYCGLDNEGDEADIKLSFHDKKTITSALRRFVPMGISTEEVWTANLRDIRHLVEMRTAFGAEEEIRMVAHQIGSVMKDTAPFFFQDYTLEYQDGNDIPAWITENKKV